MADPRPAVVLLAGEPPSLKTLRREIDHARLIYCADGAAEYALDADVRVDRVIGDLDSITVATRDSFAGRGTQIEHVPDQNSDDFEKTLRALRQVHAGVVRVLGLAGKRTDHTLTNFSVMLKADGWFDRIVAVDEQFEHFFLTEREPKFTADLHHDSVVSLSAFGAAHGVETTNLLYPLSGESLLLGTREGLSNRVAGSPVTIRVASGALLVSIERSRA